MYSHWHSKDQNSKVFGDRCTILAWEGNLSKCVEMHSLVPSTAAHASSFIRYRRCCDFRGFQTYMTYSPSYLSYSHSEDLISKFPDDRYTILDGFRSKYVVFHPLVPSAAVHASIFIWYRHFCDFANMYMYYPKSPKWRYLEKTATRWWRLKAR